MKYLKTYEKIYFRRNIKVEDDNITINNINVGSWVLLYFPQPYAKEFEKFSTTTPAKVIDVDYDEGQVRIQYDNYPEEFKKLHKNPTTFHYSHLIVVSDTKEECEMYLQTQKYNI